LRPPRRLLAALGGGAAVVYLGALAADLRPTRLLTKPVPVLALAGWVLAAAPTAFGRLVTAGLLLSALGDLLLEGGLFLPGLLAFLAAHLAYIAAFLRVERRPALARALPFAAWAVLALVLLRPGLGAMAVPVAVYVSVICTMMWRAAAAIGSPSASPAAARLGLAGAVAFGASDTLIAFDRFRLPLSGVGWPVMILYWLGQCGIAAWAVRACGMLRER